jgi:NAD(P)H-dependent flavin oxidoreductase YrpB (nitropropane dioxygenase family)
LAAVVRPQIFKTRITELFGISHPILCGGLFLLADARYVAAAVNAGCMGFITALSFPDNPDDFRREIRKCRELTNGRPFGVSIAFSARPGADDRLAPYVDIVIEENVRFVETSGGNPSRFLGKLKAAGCIVMHKVPAVRYALSAERMGVDAIAVVGGEAGGHPGIYMIGNIIQSALAADAIRLPLAIGGGMGTGRHLVTALAMGADAMLVGSRMLSASEIWAHDAYKQRIVEAGELDTRVVMKTFRNNQRILDNDTARTVEEMENRGIRDFEAYRPVVSGRVTRRAYETGDVSKGMIDLGPAAVFAREIRPVEEIVDQLIDEAVQAADRIRSLQMSRG